MTPEEVKKGILEELKKTETLQKQIARELLTRRGLFEHPAFLLFLSTHQPAGILHECAMQGNYEAARFFLDREIDTTGLDYRWNDTAEGGHATLRRTNRWPTFWRMP